MWEPGEPFYDARLELNRAEKNIDRIRDGLIVLVYTQTCAVLAEDDRDSPGNLIWRLRVFKEIPDVFPPLVGQTIRSIRSSINMISAVVAKSFGKLPTAPDFEGFVSAVDGLESRFGSKIGGFETLNADDGGDFRCLKSLFKVSVGDDERVAVSFHARAYRMRFGSQWVFSIVKPFEDAIVKPFKDREIVLCTPTTFWGLNCKAADSIDTSVEATFDDGGPFQGKNVTSTLESLAKDALIAIVALLPFVRRREQNESSP